MEDVTQVGYGISVELQAYLGAQILTILVVVEWNWSEKR